MLAALSLFAAAFGFWASQVGSAPGPPQQVVSTVAAAPGTGPLQSTKAPAPQSHDDMGSTLNDDKAFRSAGLKRDRPTTFALSAPRWSWTLSSLAPATGAYRPVDARRSCAPSTVLADRDLLTTLCVSRR
ncbi:hypothetical protein ACKUT9_07815 [Mycobacterium seoulense]|uniref:hypothetical protein n=1 Tax=Mycobacterium seoulense TaxID=386911 RepID=UPI003CE7CAAD